MGRSKKFPSSSPSSPKGSEPTPPRITSNVKQNLQFLKLWKEFQKRKSSTPKPATSYRRKKVDKEDLPEDTEYYRDPTTTLYYTNQGLETAVPVLLVDGYNVCGYWAKLKKYFMNGRLDMARQKLIDELVAFSLLREVKVVVVFDAMLSGLPTHKETFESVDIIFSSETCADAWIEKEVVALREDGCPRVWVATSDHDQQHAAHGAGAFVWSCKALVSEIKASKKEVEMMLQEHRKKNMLMTIDATATDLWSTISDPVLSKREGGSSGSLAKQQPRSWLLGEATTSSMAPRQCSNGGSPVVSACARGSLAWFFS
uniref:YacP-like NYN domain protein n=1 Tax=Cannabis sativa TaxID=3483 RepID=A0A803PIT8_CANSA